MPTYYDQISELNPIEELKDQSTSLSYGNQGKLPDGVRLLPATLKEAVDALEKDTMLADVLGKELVDGYIIKKREQWKAYCKVVTQWEINVADDY